MCRLSFLIFLVLLTSSGYSQSPHGKKLKIECDACHSADGWKVNPKDLTFNHNKTNFPLSGQHAFLDCKACHKSLEFSKGPTDCRNCHTDMHNNTVGWDCARCHNSQSWIVKNITQMHQLTRFPLLGRHATADCYSCHPSGSLLKFEPLGVNCNDCHNKDYLATAAPNHQSSGYSTNCLQCHTMTAPEWRASGLNHSFFPLQGGHAISCIQCHTSGTYQALPKECNACHAQDYDKTTNPSHQLSNIPRTCETCHKINSWMPASFDHNTTSFPLTGAHASVTCAKCHVSGYSGTSADCNSCHAADYNKTTNPPHATAKFPADCQTCHKVTAWVPSTFNHDGQYFPVYSGRHRGTWNLCSECHPNAANFASFTCLTCHEHDQASMNSKHADRAGYSYTSSACYSCHPRGNSD